MRCERRILRTDRLVSLHRYSLACRVCLHSQTTGNRADRPTGPPWAEKVPQLLAVVEWDVGPRVSTELVGVEPDDIRIGMRVSPVFCDAGDVTLLRYRPADV